EVHPEEAETRELRDQLRRKLAALEPLADIRLHLLRDELAHGVADGALLVGEEGVEREEVARVELRLLRGRRHSRIVRIHAYFPGQEVTLTEQSINPPGGSGGGHRREHADRRLVFANGGAEGAAQACARLRGEGDPPARGGVRRADAAPPRG